MKSLEELAALREQMKNKVAMRQDNSAATRVVGGMATDDHGRTVEYSGSLSIVEITTTAGAANCHIVKPGGILTIKAVKGNSTTALDFDNAALVWQDAIGLVSLTLFVRLRLCVSLAVSETLTSVASVITSGAVSLMIPW